MKKRYIRSCAVALALLFATGSKAESPIWEEGSVVYCNTSSGTVAMGPTDLESAPQNIAIPGSCSIVGSLSFSRTANMRNLYADVAVVGIRAFYGCPDLESVELGDRISYIENEAFRDCKSLKYVTISRISNVNIGSGTFAGCGNITEVTVKAENPQAYRITEGELPVFEESVLENATLYVPKKSLVAVYAADPFWGRFKQIVRGHGTTGISVPDASGEISITARDGVITVTGLTEESGIEVWSTGGACVYKGRSTTVEGLAPGTYIVRTAEKTAKVVL